jgi:hypothetical protein
MRRCKETGTGSNRVYSVHSSRLAHDAGLHGDGSVAPLPPSRAYSGSRLQLHAILSAHLVRAATEQNLTVEWVDFLRIWCVPV